MGLAAFEFWGSGIFNEVGKKGTSVASIFVPGPLTLSY